MALAYQEYYTFEDYQHWQGDWELIGGMPYAMTPSPGVTHQTVAGNLFVQIKSASSKNTQQCHHCHVLMETDWQISNDTIVRTDVMVVCKDIDEKVLVTPELIIEVVSPSSTKRDEKMKFELYQQEGVRYYILAYPKKRLAKIYINNSNRFSKVGDYVNEVADFLIDDCRINIDFSTIWR